MTKLTPEQVLDLPMDENDAKASTIRGYFAALLVELLQDGEGFSGKRPFGNSGWEAELYKPLVVAGAVAGSIDEYGCAGVDDYPEADALLIEAAHALGADPAGMPEPV